MFWKVLLFKFNHSYSIQASKRILILNSAKKSAVLTPRYMVTPGPTPRARVQTEEIVNWHQDSCITVYHRVSLDTFKYIAQYLSIGDHFNNLSGDGRWIVFWITKLPNSWINWRSLSFAHQFSLFLELFFHIC